MVEELLETLVDEVNPQLLETVQVKDLEAGNIEHTNEVLALNSLGVQSFVATGNQPAEHASVDGLAET
jgi:hypothetical protein